jgi:hypothetical protein
LKKKDYPTYLFYIESKEVSDVLIPSCYDEDNDFVDHFGEFIHVGKCGWDMIYYMKLLIILTSGNKNLTLFRHPRMT